MNVIRRNFSTVPSREVAAAWSPRDKIFYWYIYEFGELIISGDADNLVVLSEKLGNMVNWESSAETMRILSNDALASCHPKAAAVLQNLLIV